MTTRVLAFVPFFLGLIPFSDAQPLLRKVRPSDTNPAISTFNTDSHYVYLNPNTPSQNRLLVHLPGSFGEPKRATLFGRLAADLGYHSIGLMYPNVPTVGSFCTNSAFADCFEEVRREIVEGQDYSGQIEIALSESILNRLQKLLSYLAATYPQENWGQFLEPDGSLRFDRMVISGHSQGGGHAALIAKFFPIQRAICFSSPKDWRNQSMSPPPWLSTGDWQTPQNQIFTFNHTLDEHNRQLIIWDSLGLNAFGAPVSVENTPSPYNLSRQLTSTYSVPAGDEHASTIQDNKTPKQNGAPVFLPVWTYLLTGDLPTGNRENPSQAEIDLLWPNPAPAAIHVRLPLGESELRIYTSRGQNLLTTKAEGHEASLDLGSLAPGLYYICIRNKRGIQGQRFIRIP